MKSNNWSNKLILKIFTVKLLLIISVNASYAEKKEQPKRIAVLNFSANNTSESISRIVRNGIEISLFKTRSFEILERSQMNLILKERKNQLAECADEECAAKIGKIISANFVIIGSVDKLDNFTINIKVVSVKEKRVIIAESQEADSIGSIRRVVNTVTIRVADRIKNIGKEGSLLKGIPISLSVNIQYLTPTGYLKDIVNTGYGISLRGSAGDFPVKNFIAGFEIQYLNFSGRDDTTHHATMFPLTIVSGYRFSFYRNFSFTPLLNIGVSYNTLYYYTDISKSKYSDDTKIQPLAKAGLLLGYRLNGSFQIQLGAEYGTVFEKDGRIAFVSYNAGVGLNF